jgi:hypothetical protein
MVSLFPGGVGQKSLAIDAPRGKFKECSPDGFWKSDAVALHKVFRAGGNVRYLAMQSLLSKEQHKHKALKEGLTECTGYEMNTQAGFEARYASAVAYLQNLREAYLGEVAHGKSWEDWFDEISIGLQCAEGSSRLVINTGGEPVHVDCSDVTTSGSLVRAEGT